MLSFVLRASACLSDIPWYLSVSDIWVAVLFFCCSGLLSLALCRLCLGCVRVLLPWNTYPIWLNFFFKKVTKTTKMHIFLANKPLVHLMTRRFISTSKCKFTFWVHVYRCSLKHFRRCKYWSLNWICVFFTSPNYYWNKQIHYINVNICILKRFTLELKPSSPCIILIKDFLWNCHLSIFVNVGMRAPVFVRRKVPKVSR